MEQETQTPHKRRAVSYTHLKVPYLLVLGKNEVADRTVSYRLHGEQQSTTVSMEDFLAMLQEDIRTKKLNPAAAK